MALQDLTLDIAAGEIFGLLGANGAGKTTTFKVLATLLEPTSGSISLAGFDLRRQQAEARAMLGYMPDLAPVPTDLKVGEFLKVMAQCHGLWGKERDQRVDECLEAVHLADRRLEWCRSLSRGMKQRLVLARNLLHRPRVLVLDEPASGMDPVSRVALRHVLKDLAHSGVTVLLSSHILAELSGLCTSIGLLKQGQLIDAGRVETVLSRRRPGRKLRLRMAEGTAIDPLLHWLQQQGQIAPVTEIGPFNGLGVECCFKGSDKDQALLLRQLISAGFPLVACQEISATIEDIVLEMEESHSHPSVS